MNIGIDFDNTIARYDDSFREVALAEGCISENWSGNSKTELRDHLRSQLDGEITWMKLQGRVYGKFMHRAEMMHGVANFLLKCKVLNHRVFIVSHKTEYGHFDQRKISLRQEAIKWMDVKRFFDLDCFAINRNDIYFADTRDEKVAIIAQLKCDWFIDDLPEVFVEENFPKGTQKVLFGKFDRANILKVAIPINNWVDISIHILGSTTVKDIEVWSNLLLKHTIVSVEKVSGRGNSRIYKIVTDDGRFYALKHYPDHITDIRLRLMTEFKALKLLQENDFNDIPRAVAKDDDLNVGIYSWVDGSIIESPDQFDLDQAITFIRRLYILSQNAHDSFFGFASESCLSAKSLLEQIDLRLKRLQSISNTNKSLKQFLDNIFIPLWEETRRKSLISWPKSSDKKNLDVKYRTLSPSDFGFHNALKNHDLLTFIDFEYFGWDDPVKLTSDFIWHPGMNLNSELIAIWKEALSDLFSYDPDFDERLHAAMPLYGLRWALILLNEFLPGYYQRRQNAGLVGNSYNESAAQMVQLSKAELYCEKVKRISYQLTYAE